MTSAPATGRSCPTAAPPGTPGYATLRNTIEGLNGYAKDTAHQALAQPPPAAASAASPPSSLFTALLLMAANIRKIRAWRALTASDQAAITRRARRRRTSLRDYNPDGCTGRRSSLSAYSSGSSMPIYR